MVENLQEGTRAAEAQPSDDRSEEKEGRLRKAKPLYKRAGESDFARP